MQLRRLWGDMRAPARLHCDNGKEFRGEVKRLCRQHGVKMVHGRPYRPQTQGGVERMGQTAKAKLRKQLASTPKSEW